MVTLNHMEVFLNFVGINNGKRETEISRICGLHLHGGFTHSIGMSAVMMWTQPHQPCINITLYMWVNKGKQGTEITVILLLPSSMRLNL